MKNITKLVVTLVIGGTVYSVSQADIATNFSKETGLTQQQAQEYIENIPEEELASFDEIGADLVDVGQAILGTTAEIDCVNYYYEWETNTLDCQIGKSQLNRIGNSHVALGMSYQVLDTEDASEEDMYTVIQNIDRLNADYDLEIVSLFLDPADITETKQTNLYNKSLLKAALDSN